MHTSPHFPTLTTVVPFVKKKKKKKNVEKVSSIYFISVHFVSPFGKIWNIFFSLKLVRYQFDEKIIIFGSFSHNNKFNIINLFILRGKFHIPKVKMSKATPSFPLFFIELKIYFETLSYVESNKKCLSAIEFYSNYIQWSCLPF